MEFGVKECKEMMLFVADGIISNVDFLTEADKMGDADHGTGMGNGFENLKKKVSGRDFDDLSSLFSQCGLAIMMSSGGASGAIFGTLFKNGGSVLKGRTNLDSKGFSSLLEEGLEGIMKRGGAKPGDKTMIDALHPAVLAAKENIDKPLPEVIDIAYKAAKAGSDATKNMAASSGRMKTLGERSKGYPDPGSITMYLILEYMNGFINKG